MRSGAPLGGSARTFRTEVAIIGGGLGACAAALAAARMGRQVILTEETQWLGGQLTNQAVPPDEHPWIEQTGATATYRAFRQGVRDYYRTHLPLSARAREREALNPGNGWVSPLCHDPRVAVAVLHQMIARHQLNGQLVVLHPQRPVAAWTDGDRISGVEVVDIHTGKHILIEAQLFIDATPFGDLLDLAGVEHVIGAEAAADTGEPHAAEKADPRSQQAITVCFAMEHLAGEDHTIDKPKQYEQWRDCHPAGWPGPLLGFTSQDPETHEPLTRSLFGSGDRSLWHFRRIMDRENFEPGFAASDITVVNWPQNDYWFGPVCGVDPEERARNLQAARQLSLSLLYWLQTEAPRPDGGHGNPGLRLRGDVVGGTPDGLAQAPYVRESRRLRAEFRILEQHIAYPLRPDGPEAFTDSVGVGAYRIDLHPRVDGPGYLDIGCWPFQIPLGAMIPVRVDNLLPGATNIGTTHITNGAYRLHPVEWGIGEAAGLLASFCLERRLPPRAVNGHLNLLHEFQSLLRRHGVELSWPLPLRPL